MSTVTTYHVIAHLPERHGRPSMGERRGTLYGVTHKVAECEERSAAEFIKDTMEERLLEYARANHPNYIEVEPHAPYAKEAPNGNWYRWYSVGPIDRCQNRGWGEWTIEVLKQVVTTSLQETIERVEAVA